ncbi:carbon-nitrogen hydrolase family protein [Pseudarthrobacter albicanus]|uniref:carbon-nitrogen hydrolase family protein n=1 Tax=Pseudarthrobacter albicanus TaxID=2823873 RepID=UPI001BA5A831|nr:carbon-nitrogen hydrolase family protein [Pseudarthrobacter albicanus]
MSHLVLAAVQAPPRPIGEPLSEFAGEVARVMAENPGTQLMVFPELHLFADGIPDRQRSEALQEAAQPLDGPLVNELRQLAGDLKLWLVPGSICERGPQGQLFNTSLVLSPDGVLAASYRKIFPWRPFEPYDPGDKFVTVDLPGFGRAGLSICYDAWFPEVTRQLAWMGADVIINVVKTTTPDRAQELILARANAIVNQVFMISINAAGPTGQGRSIIVDPEGAVLSEAPDDAPCVLSTELDMGHPGRVRSGGTAGLNRMWSQFRADEPPIELPIYGGRINPANWTPEAHTNSQP